MDGINLIRQMFIDREGNIWLATYQGVYNFFQLNFMNHTLTDHNDILRAIDTAPGGLLTVGTLNGKLLGGPTARELRSLAYPRSDDNFFHPLRSPHRPLRLPAGQRRHTGLRRQPQAMARLAYARLPLPLRTRRQPARGHPTGAVRD